MSLASYLIVLLQIWLTFGSSLVRRNNTGFVSVQDGQFQLDGSLFRFYGTNAYWVQTATDDDIDLTFHEIATAGFQVVRIWAFNDVSSKPQSGTFFQILNPNGTATINEGTDGLQRLDKAVASAKKYGLKLVLTLTNNWNPAKDSGSGGLPRNFLSNDYGGMDLYVQTFHPNGATHDLFYTDSNIISAFKNYISHVVSRYLDDPTVLAWEIANDLRCSSTLPASSSCTTTTLSTWVNEISGFIKTLDTKHLITAGDGGFYCLGCKKLYATKSSTQPKSSLPGPSFDGSYGVDTEDIIAIPCIDFGSFQLFPDQTTYFPETNDFATKAIGDGGKWITVHSNTATLLGKPVVLTAAAIVTKDNWAQFVPFDATAPPPEGTVCAGVSTFQETYAFTSWPGVALSSNVGGVLEYMWLQSGLTGQGSLRRRFLTISPQDGGAHYAGPATNQTAQQFATTLPPI